MGGVALGVARVLDEGEAERPVLVVDQVHRLHGLAADEQRLEAEVRPVHHHPGLAHVAHQQERNPDVLVGDHELPERLHQFQFRRGELKHSLFNT